jgi:hypothetical protein
VRLHCAERGAQFGVGRKMDLFRVMELF